MIARGQNCNSARYKQPIFTTRTTTNVKFGTATPYGALALPQDLYMDIYEPVGDTLSKRPLIVFQFGGAFLIGTRNQPVIPAFCEYFASLGYVVASIDYRLGFNTLSTGSAERAVYRAVQDQRAAIRFLAQRSTTYRLDTANIFLTGTSAGCFAGLHSTFMTQQQAPISYQGLPLEPDNLGCIDCSGNNDNGNYSPKARAIINQWGAILDTNFITSTNVIPVLSFHGTEDALVPYNVGNPFSYPVFPTVYGSLPITARVNNVGGLGVLIPLTGYGHEPELLNANLNDTIYKYSRLFLFDILRPQTGPINGPSEVCRGTSATYSVPNTNRSTYCWNLSGNGTIIQDSGNTITVVWNDTGWHSASVKELNYLRAEGDEIQFSTYVIPEAIADFTLTVNELTITTNNTSTGANNAVWQFGSSLTDSTYSPTTTLAPGTYLVTLKAYNNYCFDTATQTISIDSCPVAHFTFTQSNLNAFINASATNTDSYQWFFGDGDSASVSALSVFHRYSTAGTFQIRLRVTNSLGCVSEFTDSITISTTNSISTTEIPNTTFEWQSDNLLVKCNEDILSVKLYDLSGRVLRETNTPNAIQVVSFTQLNKAVYILSLTTAKGTFNKKMSYQTSQ